MEASPLKRTENLLDRRARAIPRGIASSCPIFLERAENAELFDVDARRYIDFAGGIAVLNVGHLHPAVKAAVAAQMEQYGHAAFQVMPYETYVSLAEKLNSLAPVGGAKKTILFSTGAEAVENAVKIARAYTGRPGVIAFTGGFHGRTLLTLAMTGKVAPYKTGFGPFPAEVYHAPYPMEYHGIKCEDSLRSLEFLFKGDIEPSRTAAIVIEPVLGEGGFYVAPFEFLRALRQLCDEQGIVLVVDEIQTGFGRTGRMFAIEHSGVTPDMITVAKSLGGGLPISGVIGDAKIMDAPAPGGLGGTYGGNPVACAAALAVLDVLKKEKLLERAEVIGQRIKRYFGDLLGRKEFECIGEVRGLGAMCALELVRSRTTREPDPDLAKVVQTSALRNGLVLLTCGVYGNVLRILCPLTIEDATLEEGLNILRESLREAVAQT